MIGQKHDKQKPRMSLLPKGAVNAVVRVLEFGAKKYAIDNWKHVPDAKTRYYDAMQRHVDAWWNGEQKDQETGEHHLAHAICCGMFLWWFDDMDSQVLKGEGFAAKFVRKGDLPERGPIDQLGYQMNSDIPQAILDAERKPTSIKDDLFQKKGETCNHFSTTMFFDGVADCINCGSTVNEKHEILECGR